jgi:hypothetical protein
MEPTVNHRSVNSGRLNVRHRKRSASRMTEGTSVLLNVAATDCVDGRSAWCRRLRSLIEEHCSDLGGWDRITAGEAAILRRAVTLIAALEVREAQFARLGYVDDVSLSVYSTASNTLRRLLGAIGLERRTKDIVPLADIIAGLDNEQLPAPKNGGTE